MHTAQLAGSDSQNISRAAILKRGYERRHGMCVETLQDCRRQAPSQLPQPGLSLRTHSRN